MFPIQCFLLKNSHSHWKCAAHSAYTRIEWSAKCVRTISFKMVGQISKYKHTKHICILLYKTFAAWFIWKISFYFAFVINFYVFPAFSWSLYIFDFFQIWFCLSREAVLAIGNWQAILLNHYLIASRFFSLSVFIWKLYFLANILLRCHYVCIHMYFNAEHSRAFRFVYNQLSVVCSFGWNTCNKLRRIIQLNGHFFSRCKSAYSSQHRKCRRNWITKNLVLYPSK